MAIEFNSDELSKSVRQAAFRGVVRATEMVRAEMVRLILRGQKSGRVYGTHQASAPGEAPASDTGRLVASLRTEYDASSASGRVVIGSAYGPLLEYGTAKMEPRPFIRPALANTQQKTVEVIAEEVGRVLSK